MPRAYKPSLKMHIIDTERLIFEVRQRPGLWDSSHESYKDKGARILLWKEICQALHPDYEDANNAQKKEMKNAIQQRWKTARDAYIRCIRNNTSGYAGNPRKKYAFYKELKFLNKKQVSNVEESTNNCNTSESDSSDYNAINNVFVECRNTDPETIADDDFDQNQEHILEVTEHERKIKNNEDLNKEIFQIFKDNAKMLKNDDLAFFMSLLPVTENFSISQKLVFRMEVLKKAMEISGCVPEDIPSSSATPHTFKSDLS